MTYRSGAATQGSLVAPAVFREAFMHVRRLRLDVGGSRRTQAAAHETDAAHQDENPEPGVGVVAAAVIPRACCVEIRPRAPDSRPEQPDNDGREALER